MGVFYKIKKLLFVDLRIFKYKFLSTCKNVSGKPKLFTPLLLNGEGRIKFGMNFQSGVIGAGFYYTNYNLIDARNSDSEIIIGDNVVFNNCVTIIALSKIVVGDNVMIGNNTFFIDSNGHDLKADRRDDAYTETAPIKIERNVMIYHNCVVLKGVTIGENSVIGTSSVVTRDIPPNVLAAGNPAKVIKNL